MRNVVAILLGVVALTLFACTTNGDSEAQLALDDLPEIDFSQIQCAAPCDEFGAMFSEVIAANRAVTSYRSETSGEGIVLSRSESTRLVYLHDAWVGEVITPDAVRTEHCRKVNDDIECNAVLASGGNHSRTSASWFKADQTMSTMLDQIIDLAGANGITVLSVRQEPIVGNSTHKVIIETTFGESETDYALTFTSVGLLRSFSATVWHAGVVQGTSSAELFDHNKVTALTFEDGGVDSLVVFNEIPDQIGSSNDATLNTAPVAAENQISVTGRVIVLGRTDASGIKIEMWQNNNRAETVGIQTTDSLGHYEFANLDKTKRYCVQAAATEPGLPHGVQCVDEQDFSRALDGVLNMLPLTLNRAVIIEIEWVQQTDRSTNLVDGPIESGRLRFESLQSIWERPGRFVPRGQSIDLDLVQEGEHALDFYAGHGELNDGGNRRKDVLQFWANNGRGGVHRLGDVVFENVTVAPDKSNGVGNGKFYGINQVEVVVGHTYVFVTGDGNNYGKFRVISVTPL